MNYFSLIYIPLTHTRRENKFVFLSGEFFVLFMCTGLQAGMQNMLCTMHDLPRDHIQDTHRFVGSWVCRSEHRLAVQLLIVSLLKQAWCHKSLTPTHYPVKTTPKLHLYGNSCR
jgi:hypothetical protein